MIIRHERILLQINILNRGVAIRNFTIEANMKTNDAMLKRIDELCKEKGVNICSVCLNGGKSPSAIYDLVKGRTKCPKVSTIKSFCESIGITLAEFFDKDYFNDLDDDE